MRCSWSPWPSLLRTGTARLGSSGAVSKGDQIEVHNHVMFRFVAGLGGVSLALTGETLGQNPGGHFGFGGPLGAANGLGPPALRNGIGGGIGPPGGGGLGG